MLIKLLLKIYVFVGKYKNLFITKIVTKINSSKVTLIGGNHLFAKTSTITLFDGSNKSDIIVGNNCLIWGHLNSQNKGKIVIGEWVFVAHSTSIISCNRIEIGKDTQIGPYTVISDNNSHPISPAYRRMMSHTPNFSDVRHLKHSANAPICIGENVWIGEKVRICKGITIGENAIIAANSVVTKNVPANAIVAGNPARIVKTDIDKNNNDAQ
jgi:acetyltransferase-like isoleucine patch superfamily enzyme